MSDWNKFFAVESPEPETAEKEDVDVLTGDIYKLILWNDDYNTFDHVINCLVKYIKKSVPEATEIAHTVHNKGKCIILEGPKPELIEYYNILKLQGLTVTIE